MAAAARAAHLLVDNEPYLFRDTMASALLGPHAEELIGYHLHHGEHPLLAAVRAQATVRSQWVEQRLAESAAAQYVILGAGLDSFGYRDAAEGIRVFEVDHPSTQRWKREILAIGDIRPVGEVVFVPVDFERDDLPRRLADAGFDRARPALVSWLGVSMYLTAEAIDTTLAALSGLAPGTELVMEYMLDPALRDGNGHAYAESVQPITSAQGEPWLSTFAPEILDEVLRRYGFTTVEHISHRAAVPADRWKRADALQPVDLCRLAHARIGG
ncbi:SAM-dependent methyltransferase [Nocardia nova]|uniref:S-adenosyl-L-methionine-dependent methyltransferase n=2 Tax=Nocardia nova TaxID=37330 RepID=A0A2S6ATR2_9NOCA|nr:SAM-dependent methyltransferase [Nocardia nova]PPJ38621.1 SAM-dependent methyltransferase [Nocardia nova]